MTPHRFLTWDVGIWLSRVGAEVMADAENGHTTIRLAMSRNTRRSSDVNFFLFFLLFRCWALFLERELEAICHMAKIKIGIDFHLQI